MKDQPMRLQKYLSECGVASRRKSEELITQGRVKINGHPAQIGDKVVAGTDIVTVSGKRVEHRSENRVYLMLNKPRGYVTTMNDEFDRKCIADLIADAPSRVYPVGRLDRDSEGMLLCTNDGDFANLLMHPSGQASKIYRVTVRGQVTDEQVDILCAGMKLDGRKTAPTQTEILTAEPARTVLRIVLNEGRNRQIRRMCEQLELEVLRLKRTAIGTLKLGGVPVGKWRMLSDREVRQLIADAKQPAPNNPHSTGAKTPHSKQKNNRDNKKKQTAQRLFTRP